MSDRTTVDRVWLSIQLEGGGPVTEVDAGYPLRDTAEVVVVVGPTSAVDGFETLRPWALSTGRWYPGASGRQIDRRGFARLVEELSGAIEQVLDDYPEADVLLSGRMTRSVQYALTENDGLSSPSRFWTSVTPVLVHLGEAKPTLVHAAQRDETVRSLVH